MTLFGGTALALSVRFASYLLRTEGFTSAKLQENRGGYMIIDLRDKVCREGAASPSVKGCELNPVNKHKPGLKITRLLLGVHRQCLRVVGSDTAARIPEGHGARAFEAQLL